MMIVLVTAFAEQDHADFVEPDWKAPLDESLMESVPEDATVKGLMLQSVVKQARRAKVELPGRGSYTLFRDYPLREYLEVLKTGAERIHSGVPIREGLRRLGWPVFENLANSLIGRVLYGSLGQTPDGATKAFKRVGKGYQVVTNHGSNAELVRYEPGEALVHLRNVWSFPDCYHVGIFEGAFAHYGYDVASRIRRRSRREVEILLTWDTKLVTQEY